MATVITGTHKGKIKTAERGPIKLLLGIMERLGSGILVPLTRWQKLNLGEVLLPHSPTINPRYGLLFLQTWCQDCLYSAVCLGSVHHGVCIISINLNVCVACLDRSVSKRLIFPFSSPSENLFPHFLPCCFLNAFHAAVHAHICAVICLPNYTSKRILPLGK